MANKLPNEQELFDQLREQNVVLSDDLWRQIYRNIEDSVLIIKLIIAYYRQQNCDIPVAQSRKILNHIQRVAALFHQVLHPRIIKTRNQGLIKIQSETQNLHPIVREMFSHYIGNDIQALNFLVGDYIDDNKNLDLEMSEKVMRYLEAMEKFLIQLKTHTRI